MFKRVEFRLRISPTYPYAVSNNAIKIRKPEYCAAKISTNTQSKKVLKANSNHAQENGSWGLGKEVYVERKLQMQCRLF
jgi:hypothetical protein